jgi:GT2 family glycosyltransferase
MGERGVSGERMTARWRASDGEGRPRVSVVTPTYNRRESLLATLRALARQTVAPATFEVLVISDGSTDGTAEVCAHLDAPYALRYFEQDHRGPAAARNLGVREARGELLVFLDDDVVPDAALIAVHLALHERHPHAVGIGPLLPPPDMRLQPWIRWEEEMLLEQYAGMAAGMWTPTFRQFYTGNASVPRQDVLDAGGFDARFRRAEDVELAIRMHDLGVSFHLLQEARGWHYARRTFRSWFDIPRAYAQADVLLTSQPKWRWMLETIGREFHTRHPFLRKLASNCIGHPLRYSLTVHLCAISARLLPLIPLKVCDKLSSSLFSILFNLRYWQTLADELGLEGFWGILEGKLQPLVAAEG